MSVVSGIMAANAQQDATKEQSKAAGNATNAQMAMYNQSREDFQPFSQPSAEAMATLQSGIYGKPMQYADPRYKLSDAEANDIHTKLMAASYYDLKGQNDVASMIRQSLNNVGNSNSYYRDAAGNITDKPTVMATAEYKPNESEGFKYTKQRTLEDLGRQLRMMGRGSGTVAANATGRTLGELNANNEQNYKNDLLNLTKIGQGAAGSTSANSMQTGGSLANLQLAQGNAAAQGNMARANLWAGLPGVGANGISSAYQLSKMFGGNGNGNGALYNEAGGNINNVNFGSKANDLSTLEFE